MSCLFMTCPVNYPCSSSLASLYRLFTVFLAVVCSPVLLVLIIVFNCGQHCFYHLDHSWPCFQWYSLIDSIVVVFIVTFFFCLLLSLIMPVKCSGCPTAVLSSCLSAHLFLFLLTLFQDAETGLCFCTHSYEMHVKQNIPTVFPKQCRNSSRWFTPVHRFSF